MIGLDAQMFQLVGLAIGKSSSLCLNIYFHVFGQNVNVGVALVGGISFGMKDDSVAQEFDGIFKLVGIGWCRLGYNGLHVPWISLELFTQVGCLKGKSSACVLLFRQSEYVAGKANLCFDFFLAVSKVVVCAAKSGKTKK